MRAVTRPGVPWSLVGGVTPGGCDSCNAEQVVTAEPNLRGVFRLTVRHDDGCPVLAAHQAVTRD